MSVNTRVTLPGYIAVTSTHRSSQKSLYNTSLHLLLLNYSVLPPPCLFSVVTHLEFAHAADPSQLTLFATCSFPELLAKVPSLAPPMKENWMVQILREWLCWNFLI